MKKCALALVALAALTLALAAVGARSAGAESTTGLERFQSCDGFLDYVTSHQLALLASGWSPIAVPAGATPQGSNTDRPSVPEASGTNVQEVGVDEPDIVKADRSRLFAVERSRLFAVDIGRGRPHVSGTLALGEGVSHELLLHGDRVFVISVGYAAPTWEGLSSPQPIGATRTVVTEIDVRDPSAMRVVGRLAVDGSYVSARLVGRTVRMILISAMPHDLVFVTPRDSSPEAIADALAQNRAILASSTPANWLPQYELDDAGDGPTTGSILGCDQVSHPSTFSGLQMLTILTFDLDKGLQPVDADGVMTDARTVYASAESLYVATHPRVTAAAAPGPVPVPAVTVQPVIRSALHKFETSDPSRTEYRASGSVRGVVRDQWSMSEHDRLLRVTSTDMDTDSGTLVTVLGEQAGKLVMLGHVAGLGRGENVYAVRFIGDAGYVVTFRAKDPLYTIDLSRPTRPRVLGKLDLLGWSSYLHPLSDRILLGVGQDATSWGEAVGTQLSVFDVGDLRRPMRLDRRRIDYASSQAEADHHAFLYWPPTRLVVVPIGSTTSNRVVGSTASSRFVGAIAYRLTGSRLDEVARIRAGGHLQRLGKLVQWSNGRQVPVHRSVVVRGTLYTVSEVGVRANDAATLADQGWAGFGEP